MNERSEPVVLFFSAHADWAMVGARFARALKAAGVRSVRISLARHGMQYPEDEIVLDDPRKAIPFIRSATHIVFLHSSFVALNELYQGKKLFVFHGGSFYRQESEYLNRFFNRFVQSSIIQTFDLLELGAKNPYWIPGCVNELDPYLAFSPMPKTEKIIVGHFPSNESKGTKKILAWAESLPKDKIEFRYDPETVPWLEHIERIRACHVIIDAYEPFQNGRRYGCWGIQALEAALLGRLVASHFYGLEEFTQRFGKSAIISINSQDDLVTLADFICSETVESISSFAPIMRSWAVHACGLKPTAERLKDALGI